jgi:acyl-phosphate glycerol 3-phosphate acyltransferase
MYTPPMDNSYWLLFPLLGYLCGSLPFSIWITRFVKNVDVRDAGSGHATTTNTIRQAGFGWGALVLILDIFKGFLPVYLASLVERDALRISLYIVPLTAACAVIGHCWPIFAQFRGGMGLATFCYRAGIIVGYSLHRPTRSTRQRIHGYSNGTPLLAFQPARYGLLYCNCLRSGDRLSLSN